MGLEGLYLVHLFLRQFDSGAVALVKPLLLHWQLLALQLGVEAAGVDEGFVGGGTADHSFGRGGTADRIGKGLADGDTMLGGAVVVA